MNYAYLHGFAKDHRAPKGERLAEIFRQHGVYLHRPNLNQPSFSELTFSGMLEAVDEMVDSADEEPWRFIGSSMGGYVAARWAEIHPEQVDRMLLLGPAFDMLGVWAEMLGDHLLEEWKEEGEFLFFGPDDGLQPVHWELFADARDCHPGFPDVCVPTRVLHGREDELVPLEKSREFVDRTASAELTILEDAHDLSDSYGYVAREALHFLTAAADRPLPEQARLGAR